MTTQATTASVLESSLRPVRAQLDLAIEQTTGTAQRSIESATVLLNQTQSLCIEQLNIETDEYNLLFDRLEKAENDLTTKSLALTHVQERIESADLVAAEANAQRDSISAKYNLSISDQRVLATEVNRLKSLNPEKMKIQIVRLKDELDNKRTLLNQQLTEIRRYKKEAAERTSKLAAMVNVNNQLANTVSDLTARIQRMDGDVEPTYYRGNDGTEFYFYTFQWGLKLRSGDYDMQLPRDVLDSQYPDWHQMTGSVERYTYNELTPKVYYLFPGPAEPVDIDAVVARIPMAVAINDLADKTPVPIDELYVNPLVDWMLFRSFSKDGEAGANLNLAMQHYQAFSDQLGVKQNSESFAQQLKEAQYQGGGQ
ncbi:phage adaptor protein [Yersinia similis]|uniref:phage adaptor protein n=1 Tax=Yersinia similis TaxID=367190 RepID=UPI0021BD18CF|nr:DUF6682 family protein [Yersinia similis]